jgi:ribosomal protein S27AE
MERLACPKCHGEMEEGFMTDFMHGRGAVTPENWMPGAPRKSFWFGTKVNEEQLRQVQTFCCTKCGYLESYAEK